MGKATGGNLTYGQPQKYAWGNQLFTVTSVEVGAEEEYPKGGLSLELTKLGLTVGLVSTAWCTPLSEKKVKTEKEGGYKTYSSQIRLFGKTEEQPENIVLYKKAVLTIEGNTAEAKKFVGLELEEAEGKALKEYSCLVFAVGK